MHFHVPWGSVLVKGPRKVRTLEQAPIESRAAGGKPAGSQERKRVREEVRAGGRRRQLAECSLAKLLKVKCPGLREFFFIK